MDKWIGIVALAAPILQAGMMGFIGYPRARRRPGGMEAFGRSGFTWWLLTLVLIIVLAAATRPAALDPSVPSQHDLTAARIVVVIIGAVAAMLAIESLAELWGKRSPLAREARLRYESALPRWAGNPRTEAAVVSLAGGLEEIVYRAIALGALLTAWELDKPIAAGAVAVAFGLAHWYFGPRVVLVKMIVGSVLCAAAFAGGWVAAALSHILLNLTLTIIARRAAR